MANFYIAVSVIGNRNAIFAPEEHKEARPGYYAYVLKVNEGDNIKARLASIGGLITANVYPSRKKCVEVVTAWNDGYKASGEYLYQEGPF